MTTLFHLNQAVIDMQQDLAREQRFGNDSRQNLLKGVALLREALEALERDINTCFDERDRAIGRVLGNTSAVAQAAEMPSGPQGATIHYPGTTDIYKVA